MGYTDPEGIIMFYFQSYDEASRIVKCFARLALIAIVIVNA